MTDIIFAFQNISTSTVNQSRLNRDRLLAQLNVSKNNSSRSGAYQSTLLSFKTPQRNAANNTSKVNVSFKKFFAEILLQKEVICRLCDSLCMLVGTVSFF